MRYVCYYVEYEEDYFKYTDDTTDEEIQSDFENWLDGATTYGWYEVDPKDILPHILEELDEDDN